ncbi:MAG TPA: hypothetical protein VLH38_06160 [Patescibacteria group bacterium]|nr:hypothetical protein [Patescibacteria group bacterium]
MEFIAGQNGPIIPGPDKTVTNEQFVRTQTAMELFRANAERIWHFKQRAEELGRGGQDTVITLINVDDPVGGMLADVLMPGHDWQRYRDAGELPIARGLAGKDGIPEFLEAAGYNVAAAELAGASELMVVVLDAEVALVLDVDFDMRVDRSL